MDVIRVRIKQSTESGRLYPRYVQDAGILAVESNVPRDWPYDVSIDFTVVFDIDAESVLANFDLHMRKSQWEVIEPFLEKPAISQVADLQFCQETLERKFFDLPVEVKTDRDKSRVLIRFSESAVENEAVGLSDNCIE